MGIYWRKYSRKIILGNILKKGRKKEILCKKIQGIKKKKKFKRIYWIKKERKIIFGNILKKVFKKDNIREYIEERKKERKKKFKGIYRKKKET